ncbi:hypothetical protein ACPWSR_01385 [Alloiococcus sp. CFN-8]
MATGYSNKEGFEIANIDNKDKERLTDLEHKFKSETGKDIVLIAWEKK